MVKYTKVWIFAAFLLTLAWCGRDGARTAMASGIQALATVPAGGTSRSSLTSGAVLYGLGTSPVGLATSPSDNTQALCGSNPPAFSATCAGSSAAVDANGIKNAIYISDTSMSANTITGTTSTMFPVAYAAGQLVVVKLANTVTGATTININSLGAVAVTKNGTTALANLDMLAGGIYPLTYDGTRFVLTQNLPAGGGTGATISSGAFGSAPSCSSSPFIYLANDAGVVGYCNGSSTLTWKYGPLIVTPFGTGDTSWYNQTSATVAADHGAEGVILTSTAGAGVNIQARIKATASTPYTQIGCFNLYNPTQFASAGLLWTDGTNVSTSKIITFNITSINTGPSQIAVQKQTGATGAAAAYTLSNSTTPTSISQNAVCFALVDDGTNRKYGYSYDKQNWISVLSTLRTDFLTPTQMGYYVNTNTSSAIVVEHLFDWETVASALF